MGTIAQLKKLRAEEGEKLKMEAVRLKKVRALDKEKQKLIRDIKKIRNARFKDRAERKARAGRELRKIKEGTKKAGAKIIRFLQDLRGD